MISCICAWLLVAFFVLVFFANVHECFEENLGFRSFVFYVIVIAAIILLQIGAGTFNSLLGPK